MKNFKSTITLMAFACLFMLSWTSNAQDKLSVNVPKDIKASKAEIASGETITAKEYYKELGGYLEVTAVVSGDGEVKLRSIEVPNNDQTEVIITGPDCPEGYRRCAEACLDKPTAAAVALCTGYCVIKCIIE